MGKDKELTKYMSRKRNLIFCLERSDTPKKALIEFEQGVSLEMSEDGTITSNYPFHSTKYKPPKDLDDLFKQWWNLYLSHPLGRNLSNFDGSPSACWSFGSKEDKAEFLRQKRAALSLLNFLKINLIDSDE